MGVKDRFKNVKKDLKMSKKIFKKILHLKKERNFHNHFIVKVTLITFAPHPKVLSVQLNQLRKSAVRPVQHQDSIQNPHASYLLSAVSSSQKAVEASMFLFNLIIFTIVNHMTCEVYCK